MSCDPVGGDPGVPSGGADETARDQVNSWLAAINPVTSHLVAERTSYSSQLIPVTPYVTVSCIEAFLRYPEAVARIAAAMSPEEIGAAARRPGCQADSVFLWGIANFFLIGRNVMAMVDPTLDSVQRTHTVLDFWARASHAYRGGPHLHAAEGVLVSRAALQPKPGARQPMRSTRAVPCLRGTSVLQAPPRCRC